MLELNFVRQNLDLLEEKLALRGARADLDRFGKLDEERRQVITKVEALKHRRNQASDEIARRKKAGQAGRETGAPTNDVAAEIAAMKQLSAEIKTLDERLRHLDNELREILVTIPNIPHRSVPPGKGPGDNLEIRRWGEQPQFSFRPKPHWELGESLGVLDLERAAKITGARFAVYWRLGAQLERALQNFMLDLHTTEHGYTEVLPPFIVNSTSAFGTGQLPKFAGDLFKVEKHDFWLVPTAEVPLTNLFRDEVLEAERLPLKLAAFTPCFRSEAGSYGKDVRGITRQHQFQKVELVKFAHPESRVGGD